MTTRDDCAAGVRVTRRAALRGALALPAFWTLAGCGAPSASAGMAAPAAPPALADGDDATTDPEVAAFLADWTAATEAFVASGSTDDDGHLHAMLAELTRIGPGRFPGRTVDGYAREGLTSGPILGTPTFLVLEFELAPGAVIQAHNHVGWSFVSVGAEGEATVRHYEPDGAYPDPGTELHVDFPLREVQRTVLLPGRSSSLTRTRANIHAFQAGPNGARFLDFGVNAKEPAGGYESFSVLDVDSPAQDVERGVHTARWIGNIYAKD